MNPPSPRCLTALVGLLLLTACATPSGSQPPGSAAVASDMGPSAPAGPSGNQPPGSDAPASIGVPDGLDEFPPACDIVTTDDLVAIVGNALADGVAMMTSMCDWESEPEDSSVSLLLQSMPTASCVAALSEDEKTDRFGVPATIHYDDLGSIPGAQATACLGPGMVLVTLTGGYGAASDADRYTSEAAEILQLVLTRL